MKILVSSQREQAKQAALKLLAANRALYASLGVSCKEQKQAEVNHALVYKNK